jgi:hypothetical protein
MMIGMILRYWILDAGYGIWDAGFSILDAE